MPQCPICKNKEISKVIYYGLPFKFCMDPKCACLFGLWDWLLVVLPFNGYLFIYEKGYIKALWQYLWADPE
jgi:hypothetical protein